MLNYLWGFMMLVGILWAAVHGNLGQVTAGALESAGEAVKLCITMLGVMSFWTGILEVGRRAGLIEQLSARMRPILRFLFPHIPENHPSLEAIAGDGGIGEAGGRQEKRPASGPGEKAWNCQ